APPARTAPPPAPRPRTAPSELQRVLDEVEQYMSLGFVDDARDALREISARYPGEAAIAEAGERLGIHPQVPEGPAAAAGSGGGGSRGSASTSRCRRSPRLRRRSRSRSTPTSPRSWRRPRTRTCW